MSAVRDAIATLRRMQWSRAHDPTSREVLWRCGGCGTVCPDFGVGGDGATRSGHACAFTRMLDDAEREARAA